MAQNTALEKAINGETLSDRQQRGALNEALEKLGKEGGKLSRLKENMGNVGEALIHTGETQGTVFIASFAEGYFGEEKMDVGPVDLRLAGGIASAGYGFYNVMSGKGGEHALAVGNGLISTAFARVGRNAGKALADARTRKDAKKSEGSPSAGGQQPEASSKGEGDGQKQVTDQGDGPMQGDFGAFVRDIFLTPDGDRAEGHRGGAPDRGGRHAPTRFIRATVKR